MLEKQHPLLLSPVRMLPSVQEEAQILQADRKSTRLNSSHLVISYAVFCLKKKNKVYYILHTQVEQSHTDIPKFNTYHVNVLLQKFTRYSAHHILVDYFTSTIVEQRQYTDH